MKQAKNLRNLAKKSNKQKNTISTNVNERERSGGGETMWNNDRI